MRRGPQKGVGAALLLAVIAAACADDKPGAVTSSTVLNTDTAPSAQATLVLDGGQQVSADMTVDVAYRAPAAAEVQLSTDPTFAGAAWSPASALTFTFVDDGYQMLFARSRSGPDAAPSTPAAAGILVDPYWAAATASAEGEHEVSWAGLAAPDVLQVRIETGRVVWNGNAPDDRLIGKPLATDPLDSADTYELSGASVTAVSRVSRPFGVAVAGDDQTTALVHDLFLTLDQPLPVGVEHTLQFSGAKVRTHTFRIDPRRTRSPAVHLNQVGYQPGDDGKMVLISAWTGAGGGVPLDDTMEFEVVDAVTEETALRGDTALRPAGEELGSGDLTGAAVAEGDFSELRAEGRYRVCVAPLGCSADFGISATSTWRRAAVTVARAMLHQRSGIALGQPHTSITRPRPFHPDDGVSFMQTTLTTIDDPDNVGGDDRFDEYPKAVTGDSVADAWGGHFDAGDWNSRVSHLEYMRVVADLVRLHPEQLSGLDLNIPESGDAVPDLLDEGLWDLDLYRRLQRADGGVPGGVDQARFGEGEETSWDNDLTLYVYAPDVWSTYLYAGVAAGAALVLRSYDRALAAVYEESAARAMSWAEAEWRQHPRRGELSAAVDPERATAAAAMLSMTGEREWNDVFAEASPFDSDTPALLDGGSLGNAAWTYTQAAPLLTEPEMAQRARQALLRHADALLESQRSTAFAWAMEHPEIPPIWGLGPSTPHATGLLRAFAVSGDARYRTAAVRNASFSLGGNPLDTSFVVGLGAHSARYPLILDARHSGLPVWPGTVLYGIHDLGFSDVDDWVDRYYLTPWGTTPTAADTPLMWSWYDAGGFPMMNEFTVGQSLTAAVWTFGMLAAT
jgi:endoglucanase